MAKKLVGKPAKKRTKASTRIQKPMMSIDEIPIPFTFGSAGLESFRMNFKEKTGKMKITGAQVKPPKKKKSKKKK